jgi:hypothetical protein
MTKQEEQKSTEEIIIEADPQNIEDVAQKNDILEIEDEIDPEAAESMVPKMNVALTASLEQKEMLISDEQYMNLITGILTDIKEDRKQVSDYIDNFAEMVINEGDATTSSKEALINLVKIKTDLQDKMLKAADLMTRLKLKNTYAYSGPHLNAMQQNNFNIGSESEFSRKELIKAINQAKKKKKE